MQITDIKGKGAITFGGVIHAIDGNGNTYCETTAPERYQLFSDEYSDCIHIDNISCKRCKKKIISNV